MHRALTSSLLLLAAAVRAQVPIDPSEPLPVPSAPALARAKDAAFAALAGKLVESCGGRIEIAQHRLREAAAGCDDPAARYLLLAEAVAIAERAGEPMLAAEALAALQGWFLIDRWLMLRDLLQRMAAPPASPALAAAVALCALHQAEDATTGPVLEPALALHDVALRASLRTGDAHLHGYVRDALVPLREWHTVWSEQFHALPQDDRQPTYNFLAYLALAAPELATCPVRQLAPLLTEVPADVRDARIGDIGFERLVALADHAKLSTVRTALLRSCRALLGERCRAEGCGDAERQELAVRMATLTERVCTDQGITALRFRAPGNLDQLVISGGDWEVRDGMLVGACRGDDFYATHRYAFRNIRSALIRGGIGSEAGLNFRCKVGDCNLLLNWEVRPENHLWREGHCVAVAPPALVPGKEHCIAFHATAGEVLVFVDDRLLWRSPGGLAGTVTVYPSLGSEIFVREILVDGELDGAGPVSGPRGEMK